MNGYKGLAPGWYIQAGGEIKSLSVLNQLLGENVGLAAMSVSELAQSVGWAFAALRKRAQRVREFEAAWVTARGGELEASALGVSPREFLVRTDRALMISGAAYWYKLRNAAGRVLALRWLDPRTIEPDTEQLGDEGIERYWRTVNGKRIPLPAEDVLRVWEPGLGEVLPDAPPAAAVKETLKAILGMERTVGYLAANPVPVILIHVPAGTPKPEKDRLRGAFLRLFRGADAGQPEHRALPVSEGVTVERISFAPSELLDKDTDLMRVQQVLAAFDVPLSEIIGDAVNLATARNATRQFVTGVAGWLQWIADVVAQDDDLQRAGIVLQVNTATHPELQRDIESVAGALVNLVRAGIEPQAAAHIVGINVDDVPDGVTVFGPPRMAGSTTTTPAPGYNESTVRALVAPDDDNALAEDIERWRRKALRALKSGKSAAVEFVSGVIPASLAGAITGALESADDAAAVNAVFDNALTWKDYP